MPDLSVDGVTAPIPISPSVGSDDVQLSVVEVRRGEPPSLSLDLDGLEPGEAYITRVSALNSDGQGPTTIAAAADGGDRGSNKDGLGIVPFEVVARAAPQAPLIAGITAVSASQLEVTLEVPTDTAVGFDVLGYKVRAKLHILYPFRTRERCRGSRAAGQAELYYFSVAFENVFFTTSSLPNVSNEQCSLKEDGREWFDHARRCWGFLVSFWFNIVLCTAPPVRCMFQTRDWALGGVPIPSSLHSLVGVASAWVACMIIVFPPVH